MQEQICSNWDDPKNLIVYSGAQKCNAKSFSDFMSFEETSYCLYICFSLESR